MSGDNKLLSEKTIHLVFEVSLWLKGLFALSEIVASSAAYFVSRQFLVNLVWWVTRDEFAEDPNDLIANFLLHTVQTLSVSTLARVALPLYEIENGVRLNPLSNDRSWPEGDVMACPLAGRLTADQRI